MNSPIPVERNTFVPETPLKRRKPRPAPLVLPTVSSSEVPPVTSADDDGIVAARVHCTRSANVLSTLPPTPTREDSPNGPNAATAKAAPHKSTKDSDAARRDAATRPLGPNKKNNGPCKNALCSINNNTTAPALCKTGLVCGNAHSAAARPFERPCRDSRAAVVRYVCAAFDALVAADPTPELGPADGGIDAIPTSTYAERIAALTATEPNVFPAALEYVTRLVSVLPPRAVHTRNAKRVFVAAVLVASKVHSDRPLTNKYWAEVSGTFTLEDVNVMEMELCVAIGFDLAVSKGCFERHVERAMRDHA